MGPPRLPLRCSCPCTPIFPKPKKGMGVEKAKCFALDQLNLNSLAGVFDAFHKGTIKIQKRKYKIVAKNLRTSENAFKFVTGGFPLRRVFISCPDDESENLYRSYFEGEAP